MRETKAQQSRESAMYPDIEHDEARPLLVIIHKKIVRLKRRRREGKSGKIGNILIK